MRPVMKHKTRGNREPSAFFRNGISEECEYEECLLVTGREAC